MAGKGSKRRPGTGYSSGWDRIFGTTSEAPRCGCGQIIYNCTCEEDRMDYVLRKAAAAYKRNNGVLPLDVQVALENQGLVIEDVINYIEEENLG